MTPAATPAAPVVSATPRVEPPVKRKQGRPRKSQEAPKITKTPVAKKLAPPRIEYSAHSSSGRGEEDDKLLGESDESDKEMEDGMSALQLRIIFGAVFFTDFYFL